VLHFIKAMISSVRAFHECLSLTFCYVAVRLYVVSTLFSEEDRGVDGGETWTAPPPKKKMEWRRHAASQSFCLLSSFCIITLRAKLSGAV